MEQVASVGDAALASYGRDIDAVGRMVVEGIRRDRLYIPTDRLAADALTQRTNDLLAAVPAERSRHDDALAEPMRSRRTEA